MLYGRSTDNLSTHYVYTIPYPSGDSEYEQAYQDKVEYWAKESFTKFSSIYRSELNSEIQICLRSGYIGIYEMSPDPWWKELVFGFRHVDVGSDEAQAVNIPPQCSDVWAFTTYICNCSNYLSWMMKQFQENGGRIEKRTVKSLDELSSFNIIINCTGVWAGNLVEEEHNVQPCRGQVVLVRAPWITTFRIDENREKVAYILPRANSVVLGGTMQMGNWSEQPDPKTAETILENALKLEPSLSRAEVIGGWAGLRPVRNRVRLDASVGPKGGLVIHCYGHGGQGVTLSWGCAKDIGEIVQKCFKQTAQL